jgi:tetratricopeptide (TPR) repeat protein/tRNA A-37 threonylcarbamoyl transferase component Bud32
MPDAGALDSGRYRIGRLLGRGGLGEVYLAHDHTLGRDVAIKFLNPDKVGHADARRGLLREARAAAALDHPYICTVYEAGETADGRGFIVMQYVEGQTLSDVLQQGAMPIRDALILCADIADALAVAHRRGVIHRDLKPGNIMVTPSGRPKLVDFGIAKVALGREQPPDQSTVTDSVLDDAVSGTPSYMSPEQVQRHTVDGRSDLFSLGLVLFECLTGRRAFRGSTPVEILANILHLHPPAPSSLRTGVTEGYDELCRRLLAKDPADRFQSADEVVGAIRVLLPDTSRTSSRDLPTGSYATRRKMRIVKWAAAALTVAAIGAGVWLWDRGSGLPRVPEASDVWYRRGIEALREGTFHTARKALEQAVAIFPQHALAYARMAEADAELDDPQSAQANLLRVSAIVPDESRLPAEERLRLQAVRALVLRDVDRAIALYGELTEQKAQDAGSIVDLGRAYEAAGRTHDARAAYTLAIARDSQYAAAHLRLGSVEALASRHNEAMAAFAEAERLYRAQSRAEGETEVLLRRGAALDAIGQLNQARPNLERALLLATNAKSIHQQIRATLSLSSVTASEGRYAESERITSEAIKDALANRLETLAAVGLIDLTATLVDLREFAKAEERALKAIELAERRGATLTVGRAKVQLAEVYYRSERSRQALATLDGVLPFLRENRHRRFELTALLIAARARESLDDLEQARRDSSELLKLADAAQNDALVATAATTNALVMTALGDYPAALRLRERAEAIHRRLGDGSLPFDLANRADLLIRLGRPDEAHKLFAEIDAGIAAGVDSYVGRRRRVTFLRAFEAATALRCQEAFPLLDTVQRGTVVDLSGRLAPSIRAYCEARVGAGRTNSFPSAPMAGADPSTLRERQYWIAVAALLRKDARTAAAEAANGLKMLGGIPNDELRWRLAAVAAAAARSLGDAQAARQMSETSRGAYERLRASFGAELTTYERRPDLADLRKREQ